MWREVLLLLLQLQLLLLGGLLPLAQGASPAAEAVRDGSHGGCRRRCLGAPHQDVSNAPGFRTHLAPTT